MSRCHRAPDGSQAGPGLHGGLEGCWCRKAGGGKSEAGAVLSGGLRFGLISLSQGAGCQPSAWSRPAGEALPIAPSQCYQHPCSQRGKGGARARHSNHFTPMTELGGRGL